MKQTKRLLVLGTLFFLPALITAKPKDYLLECWNKLVKPTTGKYLTFSYNENSHELEHSFEPWQQTVYAGKGIVWTNGDNFLKNDTLVNVARNRSYYAKTQLSKNDMLFLDYGDKDLFAVTQSMFLDQPFKTARYTPIKLVDFFYQQKVTLDQESSPELAIYKLRINNVIVKLFIRKNDYLLAMVTTLHDDELFGDVLTTFTYSNYSKIETLSYPRHIAITKINGKVKDEVTLSPGNLVMEAPRLLERPDNYKLKEEPQFKPEIKTDKYSGNIHFIELKHTDDKVMVVEFDDFLLVAEAPLNSKNGELIITEANKIAPNKPIKYFVFGHYHPHYLGGIRPFISRGAKIIASKADQEYVRYIASAPHSLNPDNLHQQPKPLVFEEINDSLTISDSKFEMKIYFIGKKSEHTNDYLIYYFPGLKMLFQDDLVWIAREGEIKKAGARQAGLYNAVKELGLDIETIVQSWPVADYGVKTVIPFSDLEKSMGMK
jgi:hypothetical protein